MDYKKILGNNIQVREIDNEIDEILLRKEGEVLMHIESMDEGVFHLVLYVDDTGRHFSINSDSKITIIDQG